MTSEEISSHTRRLFVLLDAVLENSSAFYNTHFKKRFVDLDKVSYEAIEAELIACTMHLQYQKGAIEKLLNELEKIPVIQDTLFKKS